MLTFKPMNIFKLHILLIVSRDRPIYRFYRYFPWYLSIYHYRFKKKNYIYIYIYIYIYTLLLLFLFVTYTIVQSITSSEMCSLYLTHPSAHTLGAVGTVHSSMTTACNYIQDSLVWNTLNYIYIYYITIISPINISIEINYFLHKRSQFEYSSV